MAAGLGSRDRRPQPGRAMSVPAASGWTRRAAALVAAAQFACNKPEPAVVLSPPGRTPVRVRVEIAATPSAHSLGLMYRRQLAPDSGMLFLFRGEAVRRFWMKNTFVPLDMIFLDRTRRVVGVVENAVPLSTATVGPDVPSMYVLEVHAGFVAAHGIVPGTRAKFIGVPEPPP